MRFKVFTILSLLFILLLCPGTVSAAGTAGKWVFIGDSYCMTKPAPLLPDLIADKLRISKSNRITACQAGYGFARKNRTYSSIVEKLKASRAVTNVLIFGGIYNDSGNTKSSIEAGFRKTVTLLRKKFPRAKIWYAAGNWHANWFGRTNRTAAISYQQKILARIPWYQSFCRLYNVTFLKDVQYTLRTYANDGYFITDGHHPSTAGKTKLASAIAAAIRKY